MFRSSTRTITRKLVRLQELCLISGTLGASTSRMIPTRLNFSVGLEMLPITLAYLILYVISIIYMILRVRLSFWATTTQDLGFQSLHKKSVSRAGLHKKFLSHAPGKKPAPCFKTLNQPLDFQNGYKGLFLG